MSDRPTQLAIDSETSGVKWSDTAFGVSFAWERDDEIRSGYIDLRHNRDLWDGPRGVKGWIEETTPVLLLHNAKFDFHKLALYPQAGNYHDTCLMVYLLNERYPKKLKILAQKILKEDTDEDTVVKKTRAKMKLGRDDGYDKLPMAVVAPYAIKDAEFTYRLYLRLAVALEKVPELEEVYSLERQLLLCVAGTEIRGMSIDIDYAKQRVIELGDEILSIEREIAEIVGKPVGKGGTIRVPDGKYKNGNPKFKTEKKNEFNPKSPDQIIEFFYSVGVKVSGTAETDLEIVQHPLADALRRLRPILKDRNTYFVPLVKESEWSEKQQCWVLHPNFNLTETKTYRSSSSKVKD
jgi:DNA polymerase I-like protein with 3'-5' exonuclease and polymerase domains